METTEVGAGENRQGGLIRGGREWSKKGGVMRGGVVSFRNRGEG